MKRQQSATKDLLSAGAFFAYPGIFDGGDFAELSEVEHHFALGVGLEGGDEARSPHHFLIAVGVANVDRLEKGIVERLNRNQKLRLMLRQVFRSLAPERA